MSYKDFIKKTIAIIRKKSTLNLNSTEKLVHGFFWNLINLLAAQGFPLIASIIVARVLGKVQYGELAIINSTIIFFATFAGLGLGTASTKFIAEYYHKEKDIAGKIIGFNIIIAFFSGTILTLALFLASDTIASSLLGTPNLTLELKIASFLIFFNTLNGLYNGSLAGLGSFREIARVGISQGILYLPIMIIGVSLFGLTGVVIAILINSIIGFFLYRHFLKIATKKFSIKIKYLFSFFERRMVLNLAVPTMFSSIMVGPIIWIGTIILVISVGYAQLGIFTVSDQWRSVLQFLPLVIGGVLLPLLSANSNNEKVWLENLNVISSWVLVIIIALPLLAFPEIIGALYGNDYLSTTFIQSFAIMILVSCILSYKEGIARKLIVKNLMWWGFFSNMLWGIIFITSVILLNKFGAVGFSLSFLISYSLITILFVPFYISRNVVPKNLIISLEVFLVWSILILQTIVTIINYSFYIRVLIFLISVITLIFCFYYLFRKNQQL